MSEVTTSKKINLDQLGFECKLDLNTIFNADETITIKSSASQEILEQFINSHTPDKNWVNPTPQRTNTIEEKLLNIGFNLQELKEVLGIV